MGIESEMIDGNEFFIKVDAPRREKPAEHECVCLLIKGEDRSPEVTKYMREAGTAAGIPAEILENIVSNQDKCHRMVDNPDQAFCDGCEEAEHHLAPNQLGGGRNIHKINKET